MEKKLLNLSLDEKHRKKKTKRRRVESVTMRETNDSGEDTEVWVSDPGECSDADTPCLKRENAFYGVYPESK